MIIKDEIRKFLPINDLSNLFVVADFDRTITNGSSKTSWSILSESPLVPKEYKCDENKSELEAIRKQFDIVCEIGDNYFDLKKVLFSE